MTSADRTAAGVPRPRNVSFDVSAVVDGAHVAGSLFRPPGGSGAAGRTAVLVCLPGGSYTRAYWHLEVPGRAGYSFAEDMAARGHVVLALDNLGTGESHRPPDGDRVTIELWGAVTAEVTRQLRDRLRPDGGDDLVLVGVGHSMGGYAVIAQQAIAGDYDALAILGTSNQHMEGVYTRDDASPSLEDQHRAHVDQIRATGAAHDGYLQPDRELLRALFHLPDVPPDVLAADDAGATRVPVGAAVAAVTPGAHRQAAGKVTVPVFLAFGEVDVATAPNTEVAAYTSSDDVRLLVLRGSAHCHNTATTRQILWDRLADWIAETSGRQVLTRESISGGTLELDATRHGAHGVWEDIKGRLKSAVGAQRRA